MKPLSIFVALLISVSAFAEQPEVAVTIYNQNLAQVREGRTITLRKGIHEYAYDGVTSAIDPTSVRFTAQGVEILEQNFEFDLVDRMSLMERYLGEVIDVVTDGEVVRGRLLSVRGGIILEDEDGDVRVMEQSVVHSVRFPELPEGLILHPTLRWMLNVAHTGEVASELLYLTGGMSWEASYVALVESPGTLEFSGWVQLTNRSGKSFLDASLNLMAGDVRRVQQQGRGRPERMVAADMMKQGFVQQDFFEYHLYTLPRKVTLHDNQTKQITLISPRSINVTKTYLYDGAMSGDKVEVGFSFKNSSADGLGMPLPMGTVRLFQEQEEGSGQQFIGEDRIGHFPEGEVVNLTVGNAFDIVGERTQLDFKRLGDRGREEQWKIELRNRKNEAVEITVREHFNGDWKVLSESETGSSPSNQLREWKLNVPAKGRSEITYRVRYN